MLIVIVSIMILLSAAIHIRAEYDGPRWRVYLFKPLTTLLIIGLAGTGVEPPIPFYTLAILVGLACSLAGDVFLMLPQDRFIAGLVSFLLAHLCYTAAFVAGVGFRLSGWLLLIFVAYGLILLRVLWPHLHRLRIPVSLYALAIIVMGWQACERWLYLADRGAFLAALGAILFTLSDSLLAYDRFVNRFRQARLLVLSTYFAAQWLIALSVSA